MLPGTRRPLRAPLGQATVEGVTSGLMIADPETYGAEKLWVLLEPIPIDCNGSSTDDDSDS